MARPKPTGWKARATWHGLSSPCRGDHGSRRADGGGLAAKKRKRRKNRMGRLTAEDGRRTAEDGQRRVGRQEAQKTQENPAIRALEFFSRYPSGRNVVSGGDEPNYRHFSSLRSREGNRV